MNEPHGPLARYAFGYTDQKPPWTYWLVTALVCMVALYSCVP